METLERNLQGISENLSRIFNNYEQLFDSNQGSPIQYDNISVLINIVWNSIIFYRGFRIFNNADWWREVKAVEFVSDIARHFRVSSMLAKERCDTHAAIKFSEVLSLSFTLSPLSFILSFSVKQRLSTVEGLSCAEFLYPIFQAYDFLQLHKRHGCWIQV